MVRCLVEKFEQTGSVLDAKVIDKQRTARSPELIDQLENELASDPTLSTRKLAQITGSSQSSVIRAMKLDLKKFPYKIQTAQRLSEAAIQRRLFFAADFLEVIDTGQIDPKLIIFSDGAHFWLDGYVDKQNFRIWGSQKPGFCRPSLFIHRRLRFGVVYHRME